jgi:hypothetical protein
VTEDYRQLTVAKLLAVRQRSVHNQETGFQTGRDFRLDCREKRERETEKREIAIYCWKANVEVERPGLP